MAAQAIGGKGNVAVLLGVLGDAPEVDRLAGINAAFRKYPGIKIVTTPAASCFWCLRVLGYSRLR